MYGKAKELHDSKPPTSLPIKWVGIEKLEFVGQLRSSFKEEPSSVFMPCRVNLYSSLNKNHRAVHISRFLEKLIKEINSQPKSIPQFCKDVAQNIRIAQKQNHGRATLICKHTLQRESPVTHKPTMIPLILGVDVIVTPEEIRYKTFLEYDIMITCPCCLETSRSLGKEAITHSQRGRMKLSVTSIGETNHSILLEVAESVCRPLSTTLKRLDEFHIVQESFKNPLFCEDLARNALGSLVRRFADLDPKVRVLKFAVSVKSDESIHPFSIVAYAEEIPHERLSEK